MPLSSGAVKHFIMVLKSKLTQYDQAQSAREAKRGRPNIYRLGHLLGAAQSVEADTEPHHEKDDAEALQHLKRSLATRFQPDFPPVKNVLKQISDFETHGALPSLVGGAKKPAAKKGAAKAAAEPTLTPDQYHAHHGECPKGYHWDGMRCQKTAAEERAPVRSALVAMRRLADVDG